MLEPDRRPLGRGAVINDAVDGANGLQDGSTAAYLLEPDGTVKPILKSGQVTELGKITLIGVSSRPAAGLIRGGYGIGLNRQGQVALNVSIDGGPTMLVLLTANVP